MIRELEILGSDGAILVRKPEASNVFAELAAKLRVSPWLDVHDAVATWIEPHGWRGQNETREITITTQIAAYANELAQGERQTLASETRAHLWTLDLGSCVRIEIDGEPARSAYRREISRVRVEYRAPYNGSEFSAGTAVSEHRFGTDYPTERDEPARVAFRLAESLLTHVAPEIEITPPTKTEIEQAAFFRSHPTFEQERANNLGIRFRCVGCDQKYLQTLPPHVVEPTEYARDRARWFGRQHRLCVLRHAVKVAAHRYDLEQRAERDRLYQARWQPEAFSKGFEMTDPAHFAGFFDMKAV